jgi:hypothetical protein
MENQGFLQPSDSELAPLAEGFADPTFEPLTGDEEASAEEEKFLAAVMDYFMGYIYSDEGLAKVVQALKQDRRELFEVIPDIIEPLLKKAKLEVERASGQDIPASVWFGEGGALQSANDFLFELAQQSDVPGSQHTDQYTASLINLYGKAGQTIEEEGSEEAIKEAEALMMEVSVGAQGGDIEEIKRQPKHKDLTSAVQRGLLDEDPEQEKNRIMDELYR